MANIYPTVSPFDSSDSPANDPETPIPRFLINRG